MYCAETDVLPSQAYPERKGKVRLFMKNLTRNSYIMHSMSLLSTVTVREYVSLENTKDIFDLYFMVYILQNG